MKGHGTKFGHKKEQAVNALLTQRSTEDAARIVGISPATLFRWMKERDFDAAYREARRLAFGQCISRLQQGAAAAASTLLKVLVDPATPPAVKVRAAQCVLEHAAKAIEFEEIEARVLELERSHRSGERE